MAAMTARALDAYLDWLQSLTPVTLGRISDHCAADVRFRDPFHDCTGCASYKAVLAQALRDVPDLAFRVHHVAPLADGAMIDWTFSGRLRGRPFSFYGSSRIKQNGAGRIVEHIDVWDTASLYGRLPVIGPLLNWLRRTIAARARMPG